MKKYLILFSVLIVFYGCEKTYDSVVQPDAIKYQVISVSSFSQFTYSPVDSTVSLAISFDDAKEISKVSFDLFSPSGEQLNSAPVLFSKVNESTFTSILTMSKNYVNGYYTIKYLVTDYLGDTKEAAVHKFSYDNGSSNVAPVISDAYVDPDTVTVTDTTVITVTVRASDENGQNDIELVYFLVYRPNGTTSGNQIQLNDNGIQDPFSWDETAGDGIYSRRITVDQTNTKGVYRFEFRARDRAKQISNIISYNVLIQ